MYLLGISAFYHDSAACLLKSGEILAAAQEERFSRIKHDSQFPRQAIRYCLEEAGIEPQAVDRVVFYEKPFLKFERLIETYLAFAPRGFRSFAASMPLWVREKLFQKRILAEELGDLLGDEIDWRARMYFSEHHLSHAASAFYPSPFESAAILTMDGVGEWTTTSLAIGQGNRIRMVREIHFPHSLGLLYSAFTYYTGFKVNSGEYKVMGLAPYGEPRFADRIREHLVHVAPDGSFRLDLSYFDYATGLRMTNSRFHELFGGPPREPESELTQREMDLAASIQAVTEDIILKLARSIARETGERNLCLAGGVALNCVANGLIEREGIFENIWIQPAAGDAGGALGAAQSLWHMGLNKPRAVPAADDGMSGAYLGCAYSTDEAIAALDAQGAKFHRLGFEDLASRVARQLAAGKAVGWMSGRMEFGPRALGARSILADPRAPEMQRQLNLKVKFRESFRPFAPSVLAEHAEEWFELGTASPYMLLVAPLRDDRMLPAGDQAQVTGLARLGCVRSQAPAITHVDGSARVQTVHAQTNPRYHALITKFYELTGCPLLVNTSFNVRGEPIVRTPADAFRCFMGTDLDVLVVEDLLLLKEEQDPSLRGNYEDLYELD